MSEIVVAKGGKATFSCELPDASYKGVWAKNGQTLRHDGKRILISESGGEKTLIITSTEKNDEGKIAFTTTTDGIEVPFQLVVTEPPAIDPVEFEKCATELGNLKTGAPMILKVPFSGQPPITAIWSFNGNTVSHSGRFQITTTATYSQLTVNPFEKGDFGVYEVLLKNEIGELRIPVDVSPSEVSKVSVETITVPGETVKKTSTMVVGADLEIPAKPSGNVRFDNMASNHFTIGFVTSNKGEGIDQYVVEKSGGANTGWTECATFSPGEKTVVVGGLVEGKRYTFRIKARNAAGDSESLESRAVTVQKPSQVPVLDAAVLEKLKGDQNLKSGKDFRLKIPYKGFPLPISQWSKDGKKLTTKGRIMSETSDTDTSFSISGLTAQDSGEYSLLLKNKQGSTNANFKIVIIDVPSQPGGPIDMTNVTSTEMSFSWKPPKSDGGRPLLGYLVDRKDSKSPIWGAAEKVGPDVLTYTGTGLTKGLKYSFRVRALNDEGESKPLTSQLTLASGPPGPTGALVPGKVTSSSIEVQWTEPENDGGSSIAGYVVEYKEVGGDWSVVPSSSVKGLKAERENLTPEAEYMFRVCARNSTGKGPWSETANPITAMDAPEPPVITEVVKESLKAPVTCHAGDDACLNIPVSGIPKPQATWSRDQKAIKLDDDDRITFPVTKGTVAVKIANAKRSDSGTYKVLAKNSEGEVEAEITLKVTDVPSAPSGPIKTLKASSKLLTIGWAPPADDGGLHVTQYLVEKKLMGDDSEDWTRLGKVFPGEDLKMSTDQVQKGSSYQFRVNAQNTMGHSPYLVSGEIVADDKYKPPAAVTAPKVTDVTKTSCVLSWDAPDDGGSPINGYIVEMKRVGRRNWVPQNSGRLVSDSTLKIKDLSQDCEYQFRVQAENEGGIGPHGAESEVIVAKDPMPPPPSPTDLKIVDMTDQSVSLEWQSPPNVNPDQFNGYFVERCQDGTDSWMKCNEVPIRASKYKISGLKHGDKYKFRVRPYNDGGYGISCDIANVVEVKQIHEKPVISFDSSVKQSIEVPASGTLRLIAAISGRPKPVVRWSKEGVDLEKRGIILEQDGVAQITIRNLTKSDSGTYVLNAENPSGSIRRAVNLVVKDAPDPPCNIRLGELQEDGALMITWDPPKNDGGNAIKYYCLQKRDAYSRSFQTVKDKISGTQYLIKDLNPGQTYYFRVIAENENGRGDGMQSNLLTVVQKRGPLKINRIKYGKIDLSKPASFSLALKPVKIKERRTAKFTCATAGKPDPEIQWYKDGVRIRANNKFSLMNNYGVCTLTISDCRPRDSGMYKCEAANATGRAVSEANLAVMAE